MDLRHHLHSLLVIEVVLKVIVGKNPRNTGELPCPTRLSSAKSQELWSQVTATLSLPQIPPQNTSMMLKADYLWNLGSTPHETPAGTPSNSQGLGCVPGARAGVCPPTQSPLRGTLHIHRHWFAHTKPSSCNNSCNNCNYYTTSVAPRLLLSRADHSQPKKSTKCSLSKYPCPGGAERGLWHQDKAVTPHTNPSQKLPPLLPSQQGIKWINTASKEQILEHPKQPRDQREHRLPSSSAILSFEAGDAPVLFGSDTNCRSWG